MATPCLIFLVSILVLFLISQSTGQFTYLDHGKNNYGARRATGYNITLSDDNDVYDLIEEAKLHRSRLDIMAVNVRISKNLILRGIPQFRIVALRCFFDVPDFTLIDITAPTYSYKEFDGGNIKIVWKKHLVKILRFISGVAMVQKVILERMDKME